jgi:Tol biopolymer transport system component
VRLAEGILGAPALAGDGTLAYVSGVGSRVQLVWVTRQGHDEAVDLETGDFGDVALSPDGHRLDWHPRELRDEFRLVDRRPHAADAHQVDDGRRCRFPLWTRDSRSIVYSSTLEGGRNIFRRAADGSGKPERLTQSTNRQSPWTWSKDGRTLVLNELRSKAEYDLMTVPADGGAESVLLEGPGSDRTPAVSPDGRRIAYQSNEAGTTQVIVRPFPNVTDRRWQVSTNGGGSRSGRRTDASSSIDAAPPS